MTQEASVNYSAEIFKARKQRSKPERKGQSQCHEYPDKEKTKTKKNVNDKEISICFRLEEVINKDDPFVFGFRKSCLYISTYILFR